MRTNIQKIMKDNKGCLTELSKVLDRRLRGVYHILKKDPMKVQMATKRRYYNGLIELQVIKKEDFTYLSLFEYENNKKDTVLPVS